MVKRAIKGRDFERQIVQQLKEIFPNAHRGRQNQRGGAKTSPDIEGTPLWIECKRNAESVKYNNAYDKATLQRNMYEADKRPVAVIGRVDRGDAMIHLDLNTFISLILEKSQNESKEKCFKCSGKFRKEELSNFIGNNGDRIFLCPSCY